MTALITIRMAGSVVQACDARCYGAKHKPCTCCCDGANHGVGLELAITQTRQHSPEWIAAAGEDAEAELDDVLFQDPLFTIGEQPMPGTNPTPEEAREALIAAAFTVDDPESSNHDRTLIHCMVGNLGADWDLSSALDLVANATGLAWTDHLLNHDLVVTSGGGRVHHFDVPAPDEVIPQDQPPGRIRTTQRGFGVYAELTDCYGAKVSVHQSSSAERDAVWVTADGGGITGNKGSLHLEADQARQVRDGLNAWLVEIGAETP